MTRAIGIYREIKLAGKPGADQRILDLTAEELKKKGFLVNVKKPEEFQKEENVELIFTMARGKEINDILAAQENIFIINSPQAIRFSFNRKLTYQKMIELGANIPKTQFFKIDDFKFSSIDSKSILKPSNRHEFWFVVENENDFNKAIEEYKKEGIEEIICQKFIEGKSIKYYAIGEEVILPKETQKFSKEVIEDIKKQVILTEKVTGLKILGGDFIIEKEKNIPFCVDANDWPSMGSIEGFTQEEAANKIAYLIKKEYNILNK
jgi:glutathione synthase/RimK-type ligase-like ATP-grasp enzyme